MNNNIEETDKDPAVINGKRYSLWPQFVAAKHDWVGGTIEEKPDPMCKPPPNGEWWSTEITDIRFEPNGETSALFSVDGKGFSVAFDVRFLCVDPDIGGNGWIGFRGFWGALWRIKKRPKK